MPGGVSGDGPRAREVAPPVRRRALGAGVLGHVTRGTPVRERRVAPPRRPRDRKPNFTKSPRRGPAPVKKWPTLYGKVTRARTTPIVNPVPEIHSFAPERLHHLRPPKRGRRVCVEAL